MIDDLRITTHDGLHTIELTMATKGVEHAQGR
jgi:hypothetical protein